MTRRTEIGLVLTVAASPPRVTYDGRPLYLHTADQKPGHTNGQGLNAFGALWFALPPAGDRDSGTGTNPNPGLGY